MKWKDLSLSEKKQIYDNIRVDNPDVTYFDLKEQFDVPTYEDGKNSKEDQAWKIGETVRLAMQGRGVNQDSLQHIIDRVKMQNPPREYDISVGAIEQGKRALHGLNNTVGTALTGASLLTMGVWNAARLLNVGAGSTWRLAAAKNALTGAKAGTVADVGNLIEDPTLTNAAQVVLSKVGSKDLTTTSNKVVNTINTGFDFDDLTKVSTNEDNKELSFPSFDDGGKYSEVRRQLGLIPGTPEYFARQQAISGRIDMVQPEAYLTPAGYVKNALDVAEAIENGNYEEAATSALLSTIPWGVGKIVNGIKSRVNTALNTPVITIRNSIRDEYPSEVAEAFLKSRSKRSKTKKQESDYDAEFSEVIRRDRNIRKYEKEISETIEDAVLPDKTTFDLIKRIDNQYGTDYTDAYKRIAIRDMTDRGKYITYEELPDNKNARISRVRDVQEFGPTVDDYRITIDPQQYLPGTANHELGHLADQLAKNPESNMYLRYLQDEGNIMGPGELSRKGINISPSMQAYLSDPSEAKSHMLHLKRALIEQGKLHDWKSKVDQDTVEDFLFDPKNTGVVNNANKLQYNLYRDKSRFIDRLNNLTPMEMVSPVFLPFLGYESTREE